MGSIRNTVQHREIVRALASIQGFISAQELHAVVQRGGGRIALATVYAQLKRMASEGAVDIVMTDRGESLYRRCIVESHHHHLSCRKCGATVEVDAPDLEQWTNEIGSRFGFFDLRHLVEFSGICSACTTS